MGNKVNHLVEESFTNSIGQTLVPGDEVVFVTTGYGHRVSIRTGKFAGVYRNSSNEEVGTSIYEVPVVRHVREVSDDGEHEEKIYKGYDKVSYKSIWEKTGRRYNLVPKTTYRKSTLQRNRVFKIETPLNKVCI